MENDNTIYTATFTLTQEGLEGMVTPSMKLSHELSPDEAPAIYELMSHTVLEFLRKVSYIDDNNEVLDFDEAHEQLKPRLSLVKPN